MSEKNRMSSFLKSWKDMRLALWEQNKKNRIPDPYDIFLDHGGFNPKCLTITTKFSKGSSVEDVITQTNFNAAWQHLMKMEGGGVFVNNPRDPGGATKWGITLKTLRQYRNSPLLEEKDIFDLSEDEAKEICFNLYWTPLGLDRQVDPVACTIYLDQAFNRGIEAFKNDLAKVAALTESFIYEHPLFQFIIQCQRSYVDLVRKNPHLLEFLSGWINRTHALFDLL